MGTVSNLSTDRARSGHISTSFLFARLANVNTLQHDNTNTSSHLVVYLVSRIYTRRQVGGTIVEEVVMQLTISSTELLIDQEERVVEESQRVEDIEPSLGIVSLLQ